MPTSEVTRECTYCWGTGKCPATIPEGGSQVNCPKCEGTGRVELGQVKDIMDKLGDLEDKIDDIFEKCNDILEAVS